MTAITPFAPAELQLTPMAVAHLQKILSKTMAVLGIRLAVKNTGCSGKSYVVTPLDAINANDYVLQVPEGNFALCIDPASYVFVKGTRIDYVRKGLGGELVFENPQSKAACGCGESFYV